MLPYPTALSVPHSVDAIGPLVNQIVIGLAKSDSHGDMGEIHLFHNQPTGDSSYRPQPNGYCRWMPAWERELIALRWPTKMLPEVVGAALADRSAHWRISFYIAVPGIRTIACRENASRLVGMQRAEDNIAKILERLTGPFIECGSNRSMRNSSMSFQVTNPWPRVQNANRLT